MSILIHLCESEKQLIAFRCPVLSRSAFSGPRQVQRTLTNILAVAADGRIIALWSR
jgi:hypothetical protein